LTKIFSLYTLFRKDETYEQIHKFKNANLDLVSPLIHSFMNLIEMGLENDSNDAYMYATMAFVDKTIVNKDFILIRNGITLLTRILKIKRKYKEAYQYSSKMLQIIETIN